MNNLVPADWSIKSISDIAKVGSSKRILQSEYVKRGVPFFRSKEAILRSKKLPVSSPLYISRERFNEIKTRFGAPVKDEILVTAVGTIGVIYLIEDIEFYFKDGNLLWIRHIDRNVSSSYLAKYLASDVFQESITRITSGSSQAALTIEKLSELTFNLPPLPEQQKIAAILTSMDEVIEKTQAQIDKLKDLKSGMMQELLTKGVGIKQGGKYVPHTEFKDSPVGKIPKSWEVVKLESVALIQTGAAKSSKLTGDLVELPYLRVANVQDGFLDLSEIKTIMIPRSKSKRFLLKENDVLVNEGGDFDKLGRGSIWSGQITPCAHQNHVFVVRINVDKLSPKFFNHLSGAEHGKKYYLGCAKQTTNLASINSTQLKQFPVLLPPMEEQSQICNVLDSIDKNIQNNQVKLLKTQTLKKALMQDLLTGKVRVKVDNDSVV